MAGRGADTRWFWIGAAALVVLALAALATMIDLRIGGDPRPLGTVEDIATLSERDDVNLLFVLIDTLRADRLHSYGYARETSPVIDQLARTGVRFARHLSQSSWTKCSMASLWTGLYPARSGVTRYDHQLPLEARMPAEILRDAGFRTTGIFRNGWVDAYFGFDQGFEVYTRPARTPLPPDVRRENPTLKDTGSDTDAVRAAEQFLRVYGRERWFLYLHFMDLHEYLYDEDTAVFGTTYSDVYDNAILRENRVLDQLLGLLAEEGYLENTLIVVASDHGEAFGERGFEGHAREVYRETTEVPLVFAFPFRLDPRVTVEARTRNVDIWPTLLDLLGLPAMEGADGRSRRPEILAAARGEPPPEDGTTGIAHLDQRWGQRGQKAAPTVAVSEGPFRFVLSRKVDGHTREELFHAGRDPEELADRVEEDAPVARRLRKVAHEYLASEPPWQGGTPTLELDEMQLNQLRALGYAVP